MKKSRDASSRRFIFILFVAFSLAPTTLLAASELHITKDGRATAQGVKVTQVAGQTFFTRLYWGDSFVRLTVKTSGKTTFINFYGETIALSDIKEGDLIDIIGEVEGGTALSFITSSIKDVSIQKERSEFSGNVISVEPLKNTLALETTSRGVIVISSGSDFLFKKGNLSIPISKIHAGEKISVARGSYNHTTKTLTPDFAEISVDLTLFVPQNYEGNIKKIVSVDTLVVTVGKNDFTVILDPATSILKASRAKTEISRFEAGDKVRFYGVRQEDDPDTVRQVEILRNLNL